MQNREYTYKIYEFYVNKQELFRMGASDLYIEVTPCNGRVEFFVSDDFLDLFNNKSKVSMVDVTTY